MVQQKCSYIVSIVVAVAENNAIGKDNAMLWHLPNDFKHFKKITSGHSVIMGRKTFESIGKVLPNRKNIVISRSEQSKIESVIWVKSLREAIDICPNENEIFIIGGSQIYQQALPICSKIYLTTVHQTFNADSYFPDINLNEWKKIDEKHEFKDEKHAYNYSFSTWERII